MIRSCSVCGKPLPRGKRGVCGGCAAAGLGPTRGPHGQWSQNRDLGEQARFRRRVGDAAGWRCQFIVRPAVESLIQFEPFRCPVVERGELVAHHGIGGEPDVLVCRAHHREIDPHARR